MVGVWDSNRTAYISKYQWLSGFHLYLYISRYSLATTTSTQREPCVGIEPTTYCLQNSRTTAVLTRRFKELLLLFPRESFKSTKKSKTRPPRIRGIEGVEHTGVIRGLQSTPVNTKSHASYEFGTPPRFRLTIPPLYSLNNPSSISHKPTSLKPYCHKKFIWGYR